MASKSYQFGLIQFQFSSSARKWVFSNPTANFTLVQSCGGIDAAQKVAKQVNGSFLRSGQIDGLCRAQIKKIIG